MPGIELSGFPAQLLWASFLLGLSVCWPTTSVFAGDPSVDELIDLAPVVSSQEGRYHRIDVAGKAAGPGFLEVEFRANYRRPNQYALRVTGPHDGTPFIHQVNSELLLYDPVDGSLLYLSNARFGLKLYYDNGRLNWGCTVSRSNSPCTVLVDIRSLYDGKAITSEIGAADATSVRLKQTRASGASLLAVVDRSKKCPFRQIELTRTGVDQPSLIIHELAVDEDAAEPWPAFPAKERFTGRVRVNDFSDDAVFDRAATAAAIQICYKSFAALQNKGLRERYQKEFGVHVDWDKVEANNRTISREIREVLGPSRPHRKSD